LLAAISRNETLPLRWNYVEQTFFKAAPDRLNPWTGRDDLRRYVSVEMAEHILAGRFNPYAVGDLAAQELHLRSPVAVDEPLALLRDFLSRHGARLHVAYLPTRHQITDYYVPFARTYCLTCPPQMSLTGPQYRRHAEVVARACERLGIPFLDLTSRLEAEETAGHRLYWDYDGHMRGRGYRLVGNVIFDQWQP